MLAYLCKDLCGDDFSSPLALKRNTKTGVTCFKDCFQERFKNGDTFDTSQQNPQTRHTFWWKDIL